MASEGGLGHEGTAEERGPARDEALEPSASLVVVR
jgi:hypothetical protein